MNYIVKTPIRRKKIQTCNATALDFARKKIKLAGNTSDVGVGAVLLQEGKDKTDLTKSYFSKKLDKHQKNYSSIEKKSVALLLSLSILKFM
jgi:hypothetical protein